MKFDRVRNRQYSDGLAVSVVASLPWSTSATAILIFLWLMCSLPLLRIADLRNVLSTAAGLLPILLWLFAAVAMLWADVPWSERIHGLGGYHKLLIIPILLVQFQQSDRLSNILLGFLGSCVILLLISWIFVLWPSLGWTSRFPGVPVKDYNAQSGEFVLCAFGLLYLGIDAWKSRHGKILAAAFCLALLFLINTLYVAVSRTELVVVPVLLAGVAYQKFGWKGALATPIIAAVLATLVWGTSPLVRDRITAIGKDVELYEAGKMDQSVGQRFSFWKRSIIFIRAAPYLGNGTGSMASLFSQSAIGGIGADSIATTNPHNQLLAVAIQLGIVGAAALVCMWFAHAALFLRADLVSWLGFVVVCQNAVSSLFNSHLFDFSQGWIYVFGVGTIGGSILRRRQDRATPGQ